MKSTFYKLSLALFLAGVAVACDDDEATIFDAPTISVVANNTTPFADDEITFTISAKAGGGLKQITLDGVSIKSYTGGETEDEFTHTVTLPSGTAFGSKAFTFMVTDNQATAKTASSPISVTVKNPEERGNPVLLDNMDASYPTSFVKDYFSEGPVGASCGGGCTWDAYSGTIEKNSDDPTNPNNKVIKWTKNAFNWIWNGNDFFNGELSKTLTEDDMQAVFDGERVIQVNIYFEFVPNATEARFDWPSNGSVAINMQLGKKSLWGWNNGDLGRKMYLTATATDAKNKWQTITFSVDEDFDNPGTPYDANPSIGLDEIDRFIILPNPSQQNPADQNIWRFDNLRIIDTAEKDNNPNL
jgi:hypothetical protein